MWVLLTMVVMMMSRGARRLRFGCVLMLPLLLTLLLLLLSGPEHDPSAPLGAQGAAAVPLAERGSGPRFRGDAGRSPLSGLLRAARREGRAKRAGLPAPSAVVEPPAGPPLDPREIFLAVKTTRRFHEERLALLMRTWVSRARAQTHIFTDEEDEALLAEAGPRVIFTNCSSIHSRHALSCKMAVELDTYLLSGKPWFCHVDDDNYVNVGALARALGGYPPSGEVYVGRPSLDHPIEALERVGNVSRPVTFWFATGGAGFCLSRPLVLRMRPWASEGEFVRTSERIRLPDDVTVGYIVEALLGQELTASPLFHSHLENLPLLPADRLRQQVTLSYGVLDRKRNVISLPGPFPLHADPSRFLSLHCLLYPDTSWCPRRTLR